MSASYKRRMTVLCVMCKSVMDWAHFLTAICQPLTLFWYRLTAFFWLHYVSLSQDSDIGWPHFLPALCQPLTVFWYRLTAFFTCTMSASHRILIKADRIFWLHYVSLSQDSDIDWAHFLSCTMSATYADMIVSLKSQYKDRVKGLMYVVWLGIISG